jgi:hypothetical protein
MMYLRLVFVGLVLLLVRANGFAQEGGAAAPAKLPKQPVPLESQASGEERNTRIQLMKALDAELQARAAERKALPAAPLATADVAAPSGSMQYKGLMGDYWGASTGPSS